MADEHARLRWLAPPVLLIALTLRIAGLGGDGWGNPYYATAAHSMAGSWRAFAFASFDPLSLVSVDKPPLSLWLQAASVKVFGMHPWAVLLPGALAGTAAVAVLYRLVEREVGAAPALIAALALALSPVNVAVDRGGMPDSLLVLLVLLATSCALEAQRTGARRPLVLAGLSLGLAFETKFLAGLIVLPALAGAVLASRRVALRHVALAGAVLAAVALAWPIAVAVTPAGARPRVGSTTSNSAFALVAGAPETSFNATGGPGSAGPPRPWRLLNRGLGGQAGWLVIMALAGAALMVRRRGPALTLGGAWVTVAGVLSFAGGIVHPYYASLLAPIGGALLGVAAGSVTERRHAQALGAAVAITALTQIVLLRRWDTEPWLIAVTGAAAAAGVFALLSARDAPGRRAAALAACSFTLIAPAAWALRVPARSGDPYFPAAGPSVEVRAPAVADAARLRALVRAGPAALATFSAIDAAPLALDERLRVVALGGFTGAEHLIGTQALAGLVDAGRLRFVLVPFGRALPDLRSVLARSCPAVDAAQWGGGDFTLRDCRDASLRA